MPYFLGAVVVNSNAVTVGPNAAAPGYGGSLRLRDDAGTTRWLAGLTGAEGAKDYTVFDVVNSATRMSIDYNTGHTTFYGDVYGSVFHGSAAGLTGIPAPSVFGASGGSHSSGSVPDPGATAGSTRFLCEDGTWTAPAPATGAGTHKFLRDDGAWAPLQVFSPIYGTAILNFGVGGSGIASVTISSPTITADSLVTVSVLVTDSPNKAADEILLEPILVYTTPPVAGVGFTIYGVPVNQLTVSRKYRVLWHYQ